MTTVAPPAIVATVRDFVERDVRPTASALEHADLYPHALVARMREMGLFGALVPAAYGGLGLAVTTYAMVIEELCRGFMSLAGVINSHTMAALIVLQHGTDEQRARLLPRLARGEARGGLCLTEPHAGSDVQAIRTVARRRGDDYLISGTKMFVTNGREGNTFALLALTDPGATPPHRGMSCFVVEKGAPGLTVAKSIAKLGYKGVDTAELVFDDFPVPAANLVGGREGRGFQQVMGGLETGRINIAARAVGVAQAAWEDTVTAPRARAAAGPSLADMAARVRAARLLTRWAAGMKDRSERCDLEAGMAKLFASEAAHAVASAALRRAGAEGQLQASTVERHYRDTPLMIIGEGTNEIQRTIIARQLLERYGERMGALTSREGEPEERRLIVLAVRQFVDKSVVPLAQPGDDYPAEPLAQLAELGVLGATAAPGDGGLGLDLVTGAMLLEELARGSASLAGIVAAHLSVVRALARHGTPGQRARWLGPLERGETVGALISGGGGQVTAARDGGAWILSGRVPLVDNAGHASRFLVCADDDGGGSCWVVGRGAPGFTLGPPPAALGARGLCRGDAHLDRVRVDADERVGGAAAGPGQPSAEARAMVGLGIAATAVGVAQAAFEAALRYSQQRSTFGKPICQHQAVQLKLADMATAITAARLLTADGARRLERDGDDTGVGLARVFAADMAADVTLEAMRIHGGYGYTAEFPVERQYRDAASLAVALGGSDAERERLATRLGATASAAPRDGAPA